MDPFKFGFRNLIGITAPGAVIVGAVVCLCISMALVVGRDFPTFKDQGWLVLPAAFLLSYFLGQLLRLNSADSLDRVSGEILKNDYRRRKFFAAGDEER